MKHRLLFGFLIFSTRLRDRILISRDEVPGESRLSSVDIETETSKVLRKMTLDLRCWTSFQDGGHIKLTWPMFHISLFSTR